MPREDMYEFGEEEEELTFISSMLRATGRFITTFYIETRRMLVFDDGHADDFAACLHNLHIAE